MNILSLIFTGLAAAFLFNYSAYLLFWHNPRYMLFQLPDFFRQGAEGCQITSREEERRFRLCFYMMLLFILASVSIICTVTHSYDVSFGTFFLFGYLVVMFMNIGDILILDILLMVRWRNRLIIKCNVYPENWTLKNVLKKHTFHEHGLIYPFIFCPTIGLVIAVLAKGLQVLGLGY